MNQIRKAGIADVPRIVELLNMAYRGEASKKGWTTEADLIAGEVRATRQSVTDTMHIPGSVFLVNEQSDQGIEACVNLQNQNGSLYLGMFAVNPDLQGSGLGKKMLNGAETYAKSQGCHRIHMVVISLRTELIAWYMRHGYRDTGTRKPFAEDGLTGKHTRPLEFAVLEKEINV